MLKCCHTYTPLMKVYSQTRPSFEGQFMPALSPTTTLEPPSAQSPFASSRRYHFEGDLTASPRQALPYLHSSYGLMRQTITLRPPPVIPPASGLGRLLTAPAAQWSFPTLSLPIFLHVSGPLLRLPPRCTHPFLPPGRWPPPRLNRVGDSQF